MIYKTSDKLVIILLVKKRKAKSAKSKCICIILNKKSIDYQSSTDNRDIGGSKAYGWETKKTK